MAPSLRERLLGRSPNGGAPPIPGTNGSDPSQPEGSEPVALAAPAPNVERPVLATPIVGGPNAAVGPKLDTRAARVEQERLSAVDQLKLELHRKLVERLDLAALERITDEALLKTQIRNAVIEFIRTEQAPLSANEREEIVEQIIYEVTGLGPIEPLFRDHGISDILVNGPKDVYIERAASCRGRT